MQQVWGSQPAQGERRCGFALGHFVIWTSAVFSIIRPPARLEVCTKGNGYKDMVFRIPLSLASCDLVVLRSKKVMEDNIW